MPTKILKFKKLYKKLKSASTLILLKKKQFRKKQIKKYFTLKKLITNSAKHTKKSTIGSERSKADFLDNYPTISTESSSTSAYSSPADSRQLENFTPSTKNCDLSLFLINHLLITNLELSLLSTSNSSLLFPKVSFNNNYTLQSSLVNNSSIASNDSILTRPTSHLPVRKSLQNLLSAKNLNQAWSTNLNSNTSKSSFAQFNFVNFDSHLPILFFNSAISWSDVKSGSNNIHSSDTFSTSFTNSGYFTQYKGYIKTNLLANPNCSASFILSTHNRVFNHRKLYIKKKKFRRKSRLNLSRRKLNGLIFYNISKPLSKATKKFSRGACQSRDDHASIKPNLRRLYLLMFNKLYSTTNTNANLSPFNNKSVARPSTTFGTSLLKAPSLSLLSNMASTNMKLQLDSMEAVTNIVPNKLFFNPTYFNFRPILSRDINFYPDVAPWVNDTLVRLIESSSGKRSLIQHSMNVEHMVDSRSKISYRRWIIRMAYYERTLGHRFFMEEALHIIHLSFKYHDVKLFSSWLKAIITRISFWKTRSIFRFLKYVFNNYYRYMFDSLSIKGVKVRLKGKISAAGNSRKRTILFRSGKNSYSSVNIKCLHEFKTITTFTGVMGFQVWLFY